MLHDFWQNKSSKTNNLKKLSFQYALQKCLFNGFLLLGPRSPLFSIRIETVQLSCESGLPAWASLASTRKILQISISLQHMDSQVREAGKSEIWDALSA